MQKIDGICYREATLADIDEMAELRLLMQLEEAPDKQSVPPGYRQAVKNYFLDSLSSGQYLSAVAELNSKLVAANGVVLYTKPPTLFAPNARVAYLGNVYTRGEFRGHGIATELLQIAIELTRTRGAYKIHLGTTELGKRIYERAGFKPVEFEALELRL